MNIIQWDIAAFEYINGHLSNPVFDLVLPWLREPLFWLPAYFFLAAFLFLNFGRKAYWLVLFLVLTAGSADLISSRPIKKTFKRMRPCHTEHVHVIARVTCGSGYSFTSSHATNHFAVASFLIFTLGVTFKKIRSWLWTWATLIAFAQVYVGVHFPLDVMAGGLLGVVIGIFWAFLFRRYYPHVLATKVISS